MFISTGSHPGRRVSRTAAEPDRVGLRRADHQAEAQREEALREREGAGGKGQQVHSWASQTETRGANSFFSLLDDCSILYYFYSHNQDKILFLIGILNFTYSLREENKLCLHSTFVHFLFSFNLFLDFLKKYVYVSCGVCVTESLTKPGVP